MKLAEFVDKYSKLLADFEYEWREANDKKPESYPLELSSWEWKYHFMSWENEK